MRCLQSRDRNSSSSEGAVARTQAAPSLLYHREIGERRINTSKSGVARGALWAVVSLTAFFTADAFLFRTNWYDAYLEPGSSAGSLELRLDWLRNTRPTTVPDVLVVGDSRVAEGFSSRTAALAVEPHLHFWNFGLAGTTPRVWYYALRDADPTRRRFAAIVIAMDNYSDEDWFAEFEDRATDQGYLAMRLGLGDCVDFAASMHTMPARYRALFGCLFRGMILRNDVQAFIAQPESRIAHAADWRQNGLGYIGSYDGKPENLRGLTIDWQTRTAHFPDGVSDAIRDNVDKFVLPEPVPNTGALARYRRRWLGRILDLYKDSSTRLVFLQLPRAPLVQPGLQTPHGFLDSVAHAPRVTVLPADTFADLERPELFADGLHLNREGRPIFSTRVAEQVDAILNGGVH